MRRTFNAMELLGLYMLAYFTCRFLAFIPIFNIYFVELAAILIFVFKVRNKAYIKSLHMKSFALLIVFILLTISIYYLNVNNDRYKNVQDNAIRIAVLCIFCAFFDGLHIEKKKFYLRFALVGTFLTTVTTLINEVLNPGLLRLSASREVTEGVFLGYGGYDFIYGLVFVNILITVYLLKKRIQKNAALYVIWLILNTITIFISGYTTAAILNVIAIATIFLSVSSLTRIVGIFSAAFILLFPRLIGNLLVTLADLSFMAPIISERFMDMAEIFLGNGTSNDVSGFEERLELAEISFNTFLRHPIFGNFLMTKDWELGEHTEWIDRLAQYGIFITALIIAFWVMRYKRARRTVCNDRASSMAVRFSYLYFLILGFMNPVSYMFTVFPLLFLVPNMQILFGGTEKSSNS